MLREVFKTVPLSYWKHGEQEPYGLRRGFQGFEYYSNPIYVETLYTLQGIHVGKRAPVYGSNESDATPDSPTSIYLFTVMSTQWWPGWGFGYYRYDAYTGKFIRRIFLGGNIGYIFGTLGGIHSSKSGAAWASGYGSVLIKIAMGQTASVMVGDEIEDVKDQDTWIDSGEGDVFNQVTGSVRGYNISRFEPYDSNGSKLGGWGSGGCFAIDDVDDNYLDISYGRLRVFFWKSAKFKYSWILPDYASAIALEDKYRCYILLRNRTVILFDYLNAQVLGAGILPPPISGGSSIFPTGDLRMTWDPIFRRLLVCEATPNTPTGSSTIYIRGYRFVNYATRITKPIPLKVPRLGRTIPVLVKIVDERCLGVGGYAVNAEVSGSGALVGIPISDQNGNAFIQVACDDPEPFSLPSSGPIIAGDLTVRATATVLIPSVPVSGVPGAPPGSPGVPVPQPGEPGDGTTPPGAPPTAGNTQQAPNMVGIIRQIEASGNWNLNSDTASNGRGAFTEAAVTAMHDQDARWGHIRKNPGQTQYNGHAVDAAVWKNPDGVTGEIVDFLAGNANPDGTHATWQWESRDAAGLSKWYYPA